MRLPGAKPPAPAGRTLSWHASADVDNGPDLGFKLAYVPCATTPCRKPLNGAKQQVSTLLQFLFLSEVRTRCIVQFSHQFTRRTASALFCEGRGDQRASSLVASRRLVCPLTQRSSTGHRRFSQAGVVDLIETRGCTQRGAVLCTLFAIEQRCCPAKPAFLGGFHGKL